MTLKGGAQEFVPLRGGVGAYHRNKYVAARCAPQHRLWPWRCSLSVVVGFCAVPGEITMASTQTMIWRTSQVAVGALGFWLSWATTQTIGRCVSAVTDLPFTKDFVIAQCSGLSTIMTPFAWWIFGIMFAGWVAITYSIQRQNRKKEILKEIRQMRAEAERAKQKDRK